MENLIDFPVFFVGESNVEHMDRDREDFDGANSECSGEVDLKMGNDHDMECDDHDDNDHALNNNNMNEEENNTDIKEKLLKMNLGGLAGRLNPLLGLQNQVNQVENQDPREQLETIGSTISKLTANLAKLSSPSNIQELSLLQATLLSLQQQQLMQFTLLSYKLWRSRSHGRSRSPE